LRQTRDNDLYNFPSDKKKGIIGTIIFHIILAGILIITGFHTHLPLPEEEGILVNFGTDDAGSGLNEPMASSSDESVNQQETEAAEPEEYVPESSEETASEALAEEAQMTQDFEEAPVVEKKIEQPDPEEERRRKEEAIAEKLRQQQVEEERKRREAEEAEKRRLEQEEKRRTEIMNRTRNALENANARGSDTNRSEGVRGGEGNQGVESGSVDSQTRGEGSGTGTDGISFDLAGRQARALPKPSYDIQSEGIVVVEVTVDRNGNVTKATPGERGSTTLEEYFLRVARNAAMNAKFDRKPDAPVIQKGTITYHFILR